jgi:hypothetical protein
MLNTIAGAMDSYDGIPEMELPEAQWHDLLLDAADVTGIALDGIAAGKTPEQAADRLCVCRNSSMQVRGMAPCFGFGEAV